MDLKGITEKVVVAVIAGIILAALGYSFASLTSPRSNPFTVVYNWIDIPNVLTGKSEQQIEELDRTLLNLFGTNGMAATFQRLGYIPTKRIVQMKIRNILDYRSKEVEVAAKGAVFSASAASNPTNRIRSRIALAPIDPGKEAIVYIVIDPWLYFEHAPINVFYEGKLVQAVSVQIDQDEDQTFYFLNQYPILFYVTVPIFVIGVVICVLLVAAVIAQLFFAERLKIYNAKQASKKTVKEKLEFIELVKKYNRKTWDEVTAENASSS